MGSGDGEEDCLFLNIWTNNLNNDGNLVPVMFYIHGGGLVGGSGADDPAWNLAG
jgi:para-nitrobenzyl esterase